MKENKEVQDQFIIAYLTDLERTEHIINNASAFARLLDKGLVLLFISDKRYTKVSTEEAQTKLKEINSTIDLPFHSYIAIEGDTKKIIENIPYLFSGVLIVSDYSKEGQDRKMPNHYNHILKNFYTSRIAYFLIDQDYKKTVKYDSVLLTIEHFRESKEKILWASYFGRFASSELTLYYHFYRDDFYRRQLRFNIAFAKRMFDNFSLYYNYYQSRNLKEFVDHQAIRFAHEEDYDLIISQTTKNRDWTNLLFGLKERKTMLNNHGMPILFVNPREDLFVLCE